MLSPFSMTRWTSVYPYGDDDDASYEERMTSLNGQPWWSEITYKGVPMTGFDFSDPETADWEVITMIDILNLRYSRSPLSCLEDLFSEINLKFQDTPPWKHIDEGVFKITMLIEDDLMQLKRDTLKSFIAKHLRKVVV